MNEKLIMLKYQLIEFFNNPKFLNKKYLFNELKKVFCSEQGFNGEILIKALEELEVEGVIYHDDKKDMYRLFPRELGYVQGTIKINKHKEGFILTDNKEKYKVLTNDLNDALDGDIVIIKCSDRKEHGHIISKVEKIIKRKDGLVIVEVTNKNGELILKPFNVHLNHRISINGMASKPLVDGERFLVKIDKLNKSVYNADFVKDIGHKDDPDIDLKMIAIEHKITIDFSVKALKEAERLPTFVREEDKEGRLDLTNKLIFTIDGIHTKDRDDAVSLEINECGNYVLGVHISDVTYYIRPGMQLWDEAIERGNSVYMVNTVIPQFPHIISNGICSLNPNEDRLCLSCIMEITPDGQVIDYNFVDTVINSRKAMNYDDVNVILEEGTLVSGYEEFVDNLILMKELSSKLENEKINRGYVDFGNNDIEVEFDENGMPIGFKKRIQRTAEKIIENFMLLAGESYANFMILPSPLRIHEKPDEEVVEEAFNILERSGKKVKSVHEIINGKVISQVLSQFSNMEERNIVANIMLHAMKKARYDVENYGHFGLGLPKYGHFTSPIRRAADMLAHYNLKQQRDNKFNFKLVDVVYDDMAEICRHISIKERNADDAEREANKFEMIRYMSNHIGEKFKARITYLNPEGIYIKTENDIYGKIAIEDLKGDKFYYDKSTASFVGKSSRVKMRIGKLLTLTVLDTKKEYHTVNFSLEKDDLALLLKQRNELKSKSVNK